jgi:hypothetical protein
MKCISEVSRNILQALTAPYWMWKRNINQFINMDYEITYSTRRLEQGYALSKPRIFWFNHIDWLKNTALKIYDWKQRRDPQNPYPPPPSNVPTNIASNTKCKKYWTEKVLCFIWNWKCCYQSPAMHRPSGRCYSTKAPIEICWIITFNIGKHRQFTYNVILWRVPVNIFVTERQQYVPFELLLTYM